jgi:hypothetical protein
MWTEEVPKAVWSHNTSVSRATNFTSLKLLFSKEVVMLEEIKFKNAIEAESKDLLESDRIKRVKTKVWKDKKVKEKAFEVGDLVHHEAHPQRIWAS